MSSPEEKNASRRGRRKFRHEMLKRMEKVAMRRMRCFATNAQILAAAKSMTDRYMRSVDHAPTQVKPIEDVILNQGTRTLA